tara:strand:- start:946 stop:1068 length:123 start_codon:yes stop_codon:yes gene_type:complete
MYKREKFAYDQQEIKRLHETIKHLRQEVKRLKHLIKYPEV